MNVMDLLRLDGRTAIVTGATKGLGKAMAEGLAEAGADVVIVSRNQEQTTTVAAEIAAATGRKVQGYACDVTIPEQVDALVEQVLADFGGVHILVNNAGINIRNPIEELSLEEFNEVYNINVVGPWLMCKAVGKHLVAQEYGRIVNIGSTLSIIALPGRTPYASSKGAVWQMTRALALEWAQKGITVNCMMPGPFATEMNKPLMDDPVAFKDFVAKIPMGRWGELDEIKGLAVFLASDASSFITGAGITIDGGWTVH
ncbi:MAG: glucose 1-dehydrogenase [Litorilinea sp.]